MNPVKKFALAASFVTCFPLCRTPVEWDSMGSLAKYLSLVGLLVGALVCAAAWLLNLLHPNPLLLAVILTFVWLGTTGGIHFDGLMDTADGIFSHRDPKRMLEIMSDSRVGNFGAVAGFAVLFLKVACLYSLSFDQLWQTILVVPAWARFCETYAIGAFPYLREQGMGKIWHDTTKLPLDGLLAAIAPLAVTAGAAYSGWSLSVVAAIGAVIAGLFAAYAIDAKLKGQTGDTYGAIVEISEVGALLLAALYCC